jgi:hypothetical protein
VRAAAEAAGLRLGLRRLVKEEGGRGWGVGVDDGRWNGNVANHVRRQRAADLKYLMGAERMGGGRCGCLTKG